MSRLAWLVIVVSPFEKIDMKFSAEKVPEIVQKRRWWFLHLRYQNSFFMRQATSTNHLSNEKNPGWLDYIGDYTTQLYRDYNKPIIRIPINQPV